MHATWPPRKPAATTASPNLPRNITRRSLRCTHDTDSARARQPDTAGGNKHSKKNNRENKQARSAKYNTTQHNTTQHNTAQHNTTQHREASRRTSAQTRSLSLSGATLWYSPSSHSVHDSQASGPGSDLKVPLQSKHNNRGTAKERQMRPEGVKAKEVFM